MWISLLILFDLHRCFEISWVLCCSYNIIAQCRPTYNVKKYIVRRRFELFNRNIGDSRYDNYSNAFVSCPCCARVANDTTQYTITCSTIVFLEAFQTAVLPHVIAVLSINMRMRLFSLQSQFLSIFQTRKLNTVHNIMCRCFIN